MASIRPELFPDDGSERRGERRYPALDNTSLVGWWQEDRPRTTAAQLMDVSREGLLVLVDDEPPGDLPIFVRLVSPTRTPWVEAVVTESRRLRHGPYQLRMAFRNTPPAGFLAIAAARNGEVN